MAKPTILPPGQVPGSKSLFDDFVAVHLNQTLFIHQTVSEPKESALCVLANLCCDAGQLSDMAPILHPCI